MIDGVRIIHAGNVARSRDVAQAKEIKMAVNKPTGDNARKGAVRKRSQIATKIQGEDTWTKRSKETGEFMSQKRAPAATRYKGVRKEQ